MWHILKLTYKLPDAEDAKVNMHGYGPLQDAMRLFDQLESGYLLGMPVRVKGGKFIEVTGISLYESFKDRYADAIEAVRSGSATLMREAKEIPIDVD